MVHREIIKTKETDEYIKIIEYPIHGGNVSKCKKFLNQIIKSKKTIIIESNSCSLASVIWNASKYLQ